MRKAKICINRIAAAVLEELADSGYRLTYHDDYTGAPISLTMPIKKREYEFKKFPAFFEGLLPEGNMLEALLKKYKLDKDDFFGHLIQVGQDVVGSVTIEKIK